MISQIRLQLIAALCLPLLAGCTPPKPDPHAGKTSPILKGVKLQLLVVDDPALAKAIERMRGQWQAETGSEYTVRQSDGMWTGETDGLAADAAIIPSALLAPMAEKNHLAPLPTDFENNPAWGEIFDLLKLHEADWGGKVYAVPFGSPVLFLYYRADLLEKIDATPPETWKEYQELARRLAADNPPGTESWSGVLEPLAPGWSGLVLLARAASYAKHHDNYSTLFNIQTMEPLIAGPPFIQALEEMVATDQSAAQLMLRLDPAGVRQAFWQGKCGMAMTWPSATAEILHFAEENKKSLPGEDLGIAELPGSTRVYSLADRAWVDRKEGESTRVPLLAVAGRVGVVSAQSTHPEAAFRLLQRLSDAKISGEICPASPATTLFRNSHQQNPQSWGEEPIPAKTMVDYAAMLSTAMRRTEWLAFRLPGREEYLSALDEAVRSAVLDKASPEAALKKTAAQWRKITEKRGKEAQLKAYLHSLGLEE
ncbi:MAG: extracellular solute-binding protein [Pirellulales bacterium]|nr:extracellular solute-binding protein [Pirellulales bacterium]